MTTPASRSVVSAVVRPPAPEVLMIGARRSLGGFAEALTEAKVCFTNLGGPFGLAHELDQRQPLLLALGEELGPNELAAVGRLSKAARVPVVCVSTTTPGEHQLEEWSRAGVNDIVTAPAQLLARLNLLRRPLVLPVNRARAGRPVLVAGPDRLTNLRLADVLSHNGYQVEIVRDDAELVRQPEVRNSRVDLLLFVDDLLRPGAAASLSALRRLLVTTGQAAAVLVADASRPPGDEPETPKHGFTVVGQNTAPDLIVRRVDELLGRTPSSLNAQTREPFHARIFFREAGAGHPWSSGYSFAMSVNGLFVKTLVPLRPGAPLELEFTGDGEQVELTGVVAWSNAFSRKPEFSCPVGMGVQFLGARSPALRRLQERSKQAS